MTPNIYIFMWVPKQDIDFVADSIEQQLSSRCLEGLARSEEIDPEVMTFVLKQNATSKQSFELVLDYNVDHLVDKMAPAHQHSSVSTQYFIAPKQDFLDELYRVYCQSYAGKETKTYLKEIFPGFKGNFVDINLAKNFVELFKGL